jgi:hypothetical protein
MKKKRLIRCWPTFVPAFLLLTSPEGQSLSSGQSGSGAKGSNLHVSVTIPFRSELKVVSQIRSIAIAQQDIERGYLEMAAATKISVFNNDKSGSLLLFEGLDKPFKKALISGLDREVQVSLPAAFIHLPYNKQSASYTLSYRFDLTDDARPGEYNWPFSISLQSNR